MRWESVMWRLGYGRFFHVLVPVVAVLISVMLIVATQAVAQTDPLKDQTATIEDDTNDADDTPNTVAIAVADCTVDANATVVVEDSTATQVEDSTATQVTLTNGENVDITTTETPDSILITGTGTDDNIEGGNPTGGGDNTLNRGQGRVISSTGITCGDDQYDGDQYDGDQYDDGQDDQGCENPQEVETFTGTENDRTDPFEITGETFRIRYETAPVGDDPFLPSVEVDILDENGESIGEVVFEGEDGVENILAGPGTFSLEIRAEEASYTLVVEDCVGEEPTDPPGDPSDPNDVDRDTTPEGPLPNTGGIPPLLIAGLALAGVGLLSLRASLRRNF